MHASICDILTDLVQNAIEAGGTLIELKLETTPTVIRALVKDNGKGMEAATLAKIQDPFYSEAGKHDHRRVGLGIPWLLQTVAAVDGQYAIDSQPGRGTTITFALDPLNFDTPPLGDIARTIVGICAFQGDFELQLQRTHTDQGYEISRSELQEALGDLESAENLILARQYLESQENNLTP